MTGLLSLFTSYNVCSGKNKVRIANGSLSSVVGQGSISFTPDLCLSSMLHIFKFTLNLLSINHIIENLNCYFFPILLCVLGHGDEEDNWFRA